MSTIIQQNLTAILKQVERLSQQYGRLKNAVQLLAVSKTRSNEEIRQAYAAGQRHFGESYAKELTEKAQSLTDLEIIWHFIGPLQTNKCRLVAQHCQWVHSVWREKEMEILNRHRPAHLPPLDICLQVNIDQESSKSGVFLEDVERLCRRCELFPRLKLRGLMIIPKPQTQPAQQREPFHKLNRCYRQLREQGFALDTLSMGMSNDYPLAIAEGATIIRVGNAIFGARSTKE